MALKRHHKIIIGSFTSLVIIYMVMNVIFIYAIFIKFSTEYNELNLKITQLQTETQSNIETLSNTLMQTKESLTNLDSSFKNEISQLKASTSSDFSGVIEESIEGVLTIKTDIAQGTGFIVTKDGYVITNAHVLAGGRRVSVVNYNREIIPANLIGYSLDLDIALLKIDGTYEPLKLANSNDVQVGEKVIAIGNPLGLQFSVTEGIVSGIHREGSTGLPAYIQTDAALNPGNSGGPLINKMGEVVGINNFKLGDSESLGFALESNYIRNVVNDISLKVGNTTIV